MGHIKSQLLIWILLKRLIYIDKRFILKMTHKIWYQKSTQKEHIARINHHVDVQTYYQEITSNNIEDILDEVKPDIVIDGMDHFKIRYLINEVCHKHQIPWVYGVSRQ